MTARRLRLTLFIVMLLSLIGIVGGFYYAQKNLRGYATSISKLNADAQSGDQNIATLRQLETTLDKNQLALDNAHLLVADSATYADAAIADISRIAAESGVTIASFDFADASSSSAPTAAATPAATAAPTQPVAAVTPSGVTKKTIAVAIASPLKYTSLMKFIQGIETNKLKMQIASVTMAKDQASADQVTTQTFSIEVYIR